MTARVAAVAVLLALMAAACSGSASPSMATLRAQPILQPLPDEVLLASTVVSPRAAGVGRSGQDGAVERVVAVPVPPASVGDDLQRRYGERYRFRRTDLGGVDPVVVELRGRGPDGVDVVVTAQAGRIAPLYGAPDDLLPQPPDHPTGVSIAVVSDQ